MEETLVAGDLVSANGMGATVLNHEQNERICRIGPGTPMGKVFRRYWLPVCTSAQLAKPDGAPLRVRLLGQNFVAFRNSSGTVGLLDEHCPHRGASLALGRVEENGLRCLYHGWKFSTEGRIQDMPNCASKAIRDRVRAPAYPVREEGGLVWTFLGAPDEIPPFTRYAFMNAAPANRVVVRINVACNYLQLTEGGFDSSHVGILHSDVARPGWMSAEKQISQDAEHPGSLAVIDNDPELELTETDFGFYYAAFRAGGPDDRGDERFNVRIVPFMMPSTRIIPSPTTLFTVFETPTDDEHTSTFIVVHGEKPVDRAKVLTILGLNDPRYWSEEDCTFRANWSTGFWQDRARMQTSWTGFTGLEQEDAVISLSMGPVFDRSIEHLVPADRAVNSLRKLLLQAAERLEKGGTLTLPEDLTDVGAPDVFLRKAERSKWRELAPNHWKTSVDARVSFESAAETSQSR
jgi:phthalate 4,5-dioxygenase oxygenase subunit